MCEELGGVTGGELDAMFEEASVDGVNQGVGLFGCGGSVGQVQEEGAN